MRLAMPQGNGNGSLLDVTITRWIFPTRLDLTNPNLGWVWACGTPMEQWLLLCAQGLEGQVMVYRCMLNQLRWRCNFPTGLRQLEVDICCQELLGLINMGSPCLAHIGVIWSMIFVAGILFFSFWVFHSLEKVVTRPRRPSLQRRCPQLLSKCSWKITLLALLLSYNSILCNKTTCYRFYQQKKKEICLIFI